jgi:predicted enzyme related to lactoylglutathione lyase
MGNPVVHFEVIGTDGDKLRSYYGDLFGWTIETDPAMGYGVVERATNKDGIGIGGGVGACPIDGYAGHVTFYVEVPDVEEALRRAELLGGSRVSGPMSVNERIEIGQFLDPEGHLVGVVNGPA